jgi:hypothetical protein
MKAPHRSYLFLLSTTLARSLKGNWMVVCNLAYRFFSFAADFRLELVFAVFSN